MKKTLNIQGKNSAKKNYSNLSIYNLNITNIITKFVKILLLHAYYKSYTKNVYHFYKSKVKFFKIISIF